MKDSPLSGQAIFWALTAVALNTMSQPSGRILGFPSSWNFAIRASPLVCACSAVHSVVQLTRLSTEAGSVRAGLHHFASNRFAGMEANEDGGIVAFRANTAARLSMFGLGVVAQLILLFGRHDSSITRLLCIAYFSSFVVDEIVLRCAPTQLDPVYARSHPVHDHGGQDDGGRRLEYSWWAYSALMASAIVAVKLSFPSPGHFYPGWWVFYILPGVHSAFSLATALTPRGRPVLSPSGILSQLIRPLVLIALLTSVMAEMVLMIASNRYAWVLFVFNSIFSAIGRWHDTREPENLTPVLLRECPFWLALVYAGLHLFAAWLQYWFRFDASK